MSLQVDDEHRLGGTQNVIPFEALTGSSSWISVACVNAECHNGYMLGLNVDEGYHACDAQGAMSLGVTQVVCFLVMIYRIWFFRLL